MSYRCGDLNFSTSYWYQDVDFFQLEDRYGEAFMESIYFHIAAFDINKVASLRPDTLDWGPFGHLATHEFRDLWKEIFFKVWAQWRYENQDPDYAGPDFTPAAQPAIPDASAIEPGAVTLLQFCGGGKDSLAALKLLERGGIQFDSFSYSNSCYGLASPQHKLLDSLLDHASPQNKRRQWIFEDFLDSPVLDLYEDMPTEQLTAAETPSSVFASLPYALQHGYTYLSLGHERSADTGQVQWNGEDINHQWGKSLEAEKLINTYIRQHLISNVSYFSILKAVYDVLIFNLLRQDIELLPNTHSCNIKKPWCKKCPKCAYVWLNYMAWLPVEEASEVFSGVNLFDIEENQTAFIQLLGQAERLPFECVGQVGESQLAFELCRQKGISGKAMDTFIEMNLDIDIDSLLAKYTEYDHAQSAIPEDIWNIISPQLEKAKENTIQYINQFKSGG